MSGTQTRVARVLVVDDEALIRWSLGEQLAKAGYEVTEAADGAAALDVLRRHPPIDLVVLDLKLPDIDGLELLKRIREIAPDAPVIMMSAFATPQDVSDARQYGVAEIIAKPFDVQYLLATVHQALNRA